jgi:hypothetical protein
VATGTVSDPVPVTGLAANSSPIPLMAPPPLGREMAGGEAEPDCSLTYPWSVAWV